MDNNLNELKRLYDEAVNALAKADHEDRLGTSYLTARVIAFESLLTSEELRVLRSEEKTPE